MHRREFIGLLAGAAAWPLAARAQQGGRVYRIGFLWDGPGVFADAMAAFNEALHELGYVEGRNLVTEYRWAEGKPERSGRERGRAADAVPARRHARRAGRELLKPHPGQTAKRVTI
jgi:hypothetical protein